jgi:hypothetical protein
MPFLFGRKDDAQAAFVKIIELLPHNIQNYDPTIMANAIDFLTEHTDLTDQQIEELIQLKEELNHK